LPGGGIARVSAAGAGTWVSASTISGDASVTQAAMNSAPALSPDGGTLYVAVDSSDHPNGYLVALDSATLAIKARVLLVDPVTGDPATVDDNATSSPAIGPDGDVYLGVIESAPGAHGSRGWLLHFNPDLSTSFTPGGFGWDDTASVVPASMVASYTGPSKYLVMTKYNDYAGGVDGDGRVRDDGGIEGRAVEAIGEPRRLRGVDAVPDVEQPAPVHGVQLVRRVDRHGVRRQPVMRRLAVAGRVRPQQSAVGARARLDPELPVRALLDRKDDGVVRGDRGGTIVHEELAIVGVLRIEVDRRCPADACEVPSRDRAVRHVLRVLAEPEPRRPAHAWRGRHVRRLRDALPARRDQRSDDKQPFQRRSLHTQHRFDGGAPGKFSVLRACYATDRDETGSRGRTSWKVVPRSRVEST